MKKLCGNCDNITDGERDHIGICTKHKSRVDKRVDTCADWEGDEGGASEEIVEGPARAEAEQVEEASEPAAPEEQLVTEPPAEEAEVEAHEGDVAEEAIVAGMESAVDAGR